jgi:hypothetical protein
VSQSQPRSSVPAAARGQSARSPNPVHFPSQPPLLPDPPSPLSLNRAAALACSAANAATEDDNSFILSPGPSYAATATSPVSSFQASTASSSSSSPSVAYGPARYSSAEEIQPLQSATERKERQRVREQQRRQQSSRNADQEADEPPSELSLDPDFEEPSASSDLASSGSRSQDSSDSDSEPRRKGPKRRRPHKKRSQTVRQRATKEQRRLAEEPELTDEHKKALFEFRWGPDNRELWTASTTAMALAHAWRRCVAEMEEQFGIKWSKKKLADACDNASRVWRDRDIRSRKSGSGQLKPWAFHEQMERYHSSSLNVHRQVGSHAGAVPASDFSQLPSATQDDSASEQRSVASEDPSNTRSRHRAGGVAAAIAEATTSWQSMIAAQTAAQNQHLSKLTDILSALASTLANQNSQQRNDLRHD